MRRIVVLFFLLITSGSVIAQSLDCTAIAQKAIETTRKVCANIERNQACYGNAKVEIKPRSNVRLAFAKAGDVAPLASLETISTSSFDADAENWGLALLNIRADRPALCGGCDLLPVCVTTSARRRADVVTQNSRRLYSGRDGAAATDCSLVGAEVAGND